MAKMVKTTIDEAIARVDDWKGRTISYEPVAGGKTNPNFRDHFRFSNDPCLPPAGRFMVPGSAEI